MAQVETAALEPVFVSFAKDSFSHALSDAKQAALKTERFLNALLPFKVEIPTNGADVFSIADNPEQYVKQQLKKELAAELQVGKRKVNPDRYLDTLELPPFFALQQAGMSLTDSRDAGSYMSDLVIKVRTDQVEVRLPENFEEDLKESFTTYARTEEAIHKVSLLRKFAELQNQIEKEVYGIGPDEGMRRYNHREKTTIQKALDISAIYQKYIRR